VRICGHIAVLNSAALRALEGAGAFRNSDPGTIERDPRGEFSGIVKETALARCWKLLNVKNISELKSDFLAAQKKALGFGISAVHCILSENWVNELKAIRELDKAGRLVLKTTLFVPVEALDYFERHTTNGNLILRGKKFAVIGFKLFADGSLGARTAALIHAYNDDRENVGILNYDSEQIVQIAMRVKKLHLKLVAHAIGDRAIEQILVSFRKAGITKSDGFRIEHVSVLNSRLVSEFGVPTLCIQPTFTRSDYWIRERIGSDKSKRFAYAFKTLSKNSVMVAGSDAPVETLDPLRGIEAALHNSTDPTQSLKLTQSISLYTETAAKISPITKEYGAIKSGKKCDLVVLSNKAPKDLEFSEVDHLFVDGRELKLDDLPSR
jgi:predicted amidohydrolase YtcJ